jgi:hypothetical protein
MVADFHSVSAIGPVILFFEVDELTLDQSCELGRMHERGRVEKYLTEFSAGANSAPIRTKDITSFDTVPLIIPVFLASYMSPHVAFPMFGSIFAQPSILDTRDRG